jgi:hypothetical protein
MISRRDTIRMVSITVGNPVDKNIGLFGFYPHSELARLPKHYIFLANKNRILVKALFSIVIDERPSDALTSRLRPFGPAALPRVQYER